MAWVDYFSGWGGYFTETEEPQANTSDRGTIPDVQAQQKEIDANNFYIGAGVAIAGLILWRFLK